MVLPRSFYQRSVLEVARDLLGKFLVREFENSRQLVGRIVEVEAYDGPEDLACHASHGRTKRTEVMLAVGAFAPHIGAGPLTAIQIGAVALASALISRVTEWPWPSISRQVLWAALFTGALATSLAFGIQSMAQRFTSATHTALIFSMEPVFAALFAYLLAGERLGPRHWAGCGLILTGMLVAELGSSAPLCWVKSARVSLGEDLSFRRRKGRHEAAG